MTTTCSFEYTKFHSLHHYYTHTCMHIQFTCPLACSYPSHKPSSAANAKGTTAICLLTFNTNAIIFTDSDSMRMRSVITFRPNFVNRKTGIILHTDLKQLWKSYAPELHPQLLSLLERFGVRTNIQAHFFEFLNFFITTILLLLPHICTHRTIFNLHFSNMFFFFGTTIILLSFMSLTFSAYRSRRWAIR